jgi:hypothetical protein
MPLGVGMAPGGSSSGGYGVPDSAAVPVNAVLPSPVTGFSQSSRALNPATNSYSFTPDGRIQGVATVPGMVQLALTTVVGSSAITTLGQSFTTIQEKGANYPSQVTSAISSALAYLVNQKLVQIISVSVADVASNPDGTICQLSWRDLTTGITHSQSIGP